MAISNPSFTITQEDGGETATAVNTTTYGGSNDDRNEAAEYLLWSKTNKSGTRTFNNPEQGNVLSATTYNLTTEEDGWYELIRVRVTPYSDASNYVPEQESGGEITQYASMFYSDGKIYRALVSSIGQTPTDTDYFEEIPLASLGDHVNNTNLDVYIKDFNCEYRTNAGLRDRFANVSCDCPKDKLEYNQVLLYLKQSADTNFAIGNPEVFEKIIRDLELKLAQ